MRPASSLGEVIHDFEKQLSALSLEDQELLTSEVLSKLVHIDSDFKSRKISATTILLVEKVRKLLLNKFLSRVKIKMDSHIPLLINITYECLRTLTYIDPINKTSVVSLEEVPSSEMLLCASGHKLNLIEDVLAAILNRDFNGNCDRLTADNEEFRVLNNPFTRQPLHFFDANYIVNYAFGEDLNQAR